MSFSYVSYADLVRDIDAWSHRLPELIAVAGIPRSGMIPAAMLALKRNIHLITIEDLLEGRKPWREKLRRNCSAKTEGKILILDDSLWSGERTMVPLRKKLNGENYLFGSVYINRGKTDLVDVWCKYLPSEFHGYEWGIFHSCTAAFTLYDMDGVICERYTLPLEEGDHADAYAKHLKDAKPINIPTATVFGIVTARLEKWRPQTEEWLDRHGVKYEHLVMSKNETPGERASKDGFVGHKIKAMLKMNAHLFIEDEFENAERIARETERSVLWLPGNKILNGVPLGEAV